MNQCKCGCRRDLSEAEDRYRLLGYINAAHPAADEKPKKSKRVAEVTPIARLGRRRRRLARAVTGALAILALLAACPTAQAQALDPASAAALAETLKILGDPSARGAAIAGNPGAGDIDRQVQSLGGSPENSQAVYNLAGEVLADLVKSTGGDTGKLLDLLQRAQTDPNGFADALSPTTLQHLRELSSKISDTKR